jgi:hypothetical protein
MSLRTYGVTADSCNNWLFELSDDLPVREEVGCVGFCDFEKRCRKAFSKLGEILTRLVLHFLDVRTSCTHKQIYSSS